MSVLLSDLNGDFNSPADNVDPTPLVTSIDRTHPNPDTSATSVSYTVTFNQA